MPSPSPASEPLRRWERATLVAVGLFLVLFGAVVVQRSAFSERRMTDFGVYARAAWAVRTGQDAYQVTDDNDWHYCYPPAFAILMAPLADPDHGADRTFYMPYAVGVVLWYLFGLACAGYATHALARAVLPDAARGSRRWWYARTMPLYVCVGGIGFTIARGQVNVLLVALIAGTFAAAMAGRRLASGVWLAGAVALKVIPGYLLLFPLLRRDGRALAGVAAGAVVLFVLLPAAVWGVEGAVANNRKVLDGVLKPGTTGDGDLTRAKELTNTTSTDSQSFAAVIHAHLYPDRGTRPAMASVETRLAHWGIGAALDPGDRRRGGAAVPKRAPAVRRRPTCAPGLPVRADDAAHAGVAHALLRDGLSARVGAVAERIGRAARYDLRRPADDGPARRLGGRHRDPVVSGAAVRPAARGGLRHRRQPRAVGRGRGAAAPKWGTRRGGRVPSGEPGRVRNAGPSEPDASPERTPHPLRIYTRAAMPLPGNVENLLKQCDTGIAALKVFTDNKIEVEETRAGAIAFFDPGDGKGRKMKVVLNTSKPAAMVAAYFCHEMHHALMNVTGKSGDAKTQDQAAYVEQMVQEEAVGTAVGFRCYMELERKGLATGVPPDRYDMYKGSFERARARGESDAAALALAARFVRRAHQRPVPRPQRDSKLRGVLQARLVHPAEEQHPLTASPAAGPFRL